MISLRHSATLAFTKLRTRRIRLIVTLVVSGILFSVLIAGSLLIRGTLASLVAFTSDGYAQRFLVTVIQPYNGDAQFNTAYIKRAQEIEKARIAKKVAEAKRLGIDYDPAADTKATSEGGPDGPKQIGLNMMDPAAQQALAELAPKIDIKADLQKLAKQYNITAIYHTGPLVGFSDNQPELAPIIAGKEAKAAQGYGPSEDSLASFMQSSQVLDNELMKPLALAGANLSYAPGEAVPVLAPIDAVEKIAGLSPLPGKATPAQKLERLKLVREKAKTMTFDVCYRNAPEVKLRDLAISQAAEIAAAKGKTDYVAPTLQYAVASTPCGATVIKVDKRSADEKSLAAKRTQFDEEFGAAKPQNSIITFRVVGVLPKVSYGSEALDLGALLTSLATSTSTGWVISSQAAAANPVLAQIQNQPTTPYESSTTYIPEFTDRTSQKHFLDERACAQNGPSPSPDTCTKDSKYTLMPYGNPLASLYDAKDGFLKFLRGLIAVIAIITAIIMMGTVGKIIADSRKETSVFRAVGANRVDIAQVYLLYAGILAGLAFTVALIIGVAVAAYAEFTLSPSLSVQAVLAFNTPNADKLFHVFGVNPLDLLSILGFALVTGLVSALLPLLTNLRRNPIKDMREE